MWSFARTPAAPHQSAKYTLLFDNAPASTAQVIEALQNDPAFRDTLSTLSTQSGFETLRWETPRMSQASLAQAFECVIIEDHNLAQTPDPSAFREHFTAESPHQDVAVFPSLRGDCLLVVPHPKPGDRNYASLAPFLRTAPAGQVHALWQAVAEAVHRLLPTRPIYLNTAGDAVPWLHVRLDTRPKYYRHAPYRTLS